LLGVSGLINAYRTAAASAIENAQPVEMTLQDYYEIKYPYVSMNDVMRILKEENIGQSEQSFDIECRILLNFRVNLKEKVLSRLSRIDGLKYTYIDTQ
jgi:putative IMPACT (imprinted ancient) family translation regulator